VYFKGAIRELDIVIILCYEKVPFTHFCAMVRGLILALLSVSLVALFTEYAYAQVVKFAKTYGGTSDDFAYSVQQTSDGGYIVAGYTGSFGAGGNDFFLIKTATNGNVQWAKTYGGTSNEFTYSVQQTSDGGYILAGETGYKVFVIKTDVNGDIGSCSIVSSAIPTLGIISPRVDVASPSVSSPSLSVNSVSPTDTSPALMILIPCPSTISESCQIASGLITPYKGGIKVSGSGEFEVKVYNVSGVMVKSIKGKNEVKLEL